MRKFYTDGSTFENGKKGSQKSYFAVTDGDGNLIIDKYIGDRTISEAEGWGIAYCLKYLTENKLFPADIYSDSEFWIKVISRQYHLKKAHLIPIRRYIDKLLIDADVTIKWIERDKNKAGKYFEKKQKKGIDNHSIVK